MNIQSHEEQRRRHSNLQMAAANLELLLRSQVREILGGDHTAIIDFQQMLQYAPPETKARVMDYIDTIGANVSGLRMELDFGSKPE